MEYLFSGEISKFDEEKQIVFGWAYISHDNDGKQIIDKSGEFIPDPRELEDAAYTFVLKSRVGRDFHGKTLEKSEVEKSDVATAIRQHVLNCPTCNGNVPS